MNVWYNNSVTQYCLSLSSSKLSRAEFGGRLFHLWYCQSIVYLNPPPNWVILKFEVGFRMRVDLLGPVGGSSCVTFGWLDSSGTSVWEPLRGLARVSTTLWSGSALSASVWGLSNCDSTHRWSTDCVTDISLLTTWGIVLAFRFDWASQWELTHWLSTCLYWHKRKKHFLRNFRFLIVTCLDLL